MTFTPDKIFDYGLILAFVLIVIHYARRGFMASLVQFVGNLVSLLGALFLSGEAAAMLFDRFFKNIFVNRIDSAIAQQGSVNLADTVQKFAGFLPDNIQERIVETASSFLDFAAPDVAERIVREVIEPLITPIIAIVVFFVAFALCRLLVGFVVAVLTNFNRIPVLGHVNRFFGILMGALAACVDLYIVLCAVWALVTITDGNMAFLNWDVLQASALFKIFSGINPFV